MRFAVSVTIATVFEAMTVLISTTNIFVAKMLLVRHVMIHIA